MGNMRYRKLPHGEETSLIRVMPGDFRYETVRGRAAFKREDVSV